MNPVFVIGHRNPDTDSICSAICYAHLKRRLTGGEYIACRAGHVNAETKFVLERFGVEPPRYIKSFEPRLSDVQYREVPGISEELSLRRAWDYMNENDIQTLAVVDEDRHLKGLLTLGDIARFYIEDQDANALAEAKTSYRNLVDVLDGTFEVGDIDQRFEQGSVVVAAANPDVLEDYIGKNVCHSRNRYESQLCAIEMSAGCMVIGLGSKVSRTIRKLASENGVSIIATPYDTYTCVKVIGQAVPVRHVMRKKRLITFEPEETVEDVKRTVSKKRIRYYPLIDEQDDMSVCSHSATCWIWSVRRSFWSITTSGIRRQTAFVRLILLKSSTITALIRLKRAGRSISAISRSAVPRPLSQECIMSIMCRSNRKSRVCCVLRFCRIH
mgnify:CR=1 FL=1